MKEAFITKFGGIYPFKHITYVSPEKNDITLRIRTVTSDDLVYLYLISEEDKNQQLHNFMQYLTKPEPTTTKLS